MATADVLPSASWSEEQVRDTLSAHLVNPELIPILLAFCSIELSQSEHDLLLHNASLVCLAAVNATRQVAVRANAANDLNTAYFFHRKSELLNACLEHGTAEFFAKLHDPEAAMKFFDRLGPPPGYDDDYWDHMLNSYKEGESLQFQMRRQEYQGSFMDEAESSNGTYLQPLEGDSSIVSELNKFLPTKYRPFSTLEADGTHPNKVLDDTTATALLSQIRERGMLIQEFVQTGLPLLLNWLGSMAPTLRFGILEQCFEEVTLPSHLDEILSSRQRRHLLPEISDLPSLVGDGVDNLQQLFLRIASGQENNLNELTPAFIEAEEAHTSFLTRLERASATDRPTIIAEIDRWVREKQREHWYNVPAVLKMEFTLELAVASYLVQPREIIPTDLSFETFTQPFNLYRSRGLQLFALALIEKCLKSCLPSQPPTQSKKRKRPM